MRDRPFIQAGEQPRLFSDLVAERQQSDPLYRRRRETMAAIAELEGRAAEAEDPATRKQLQCEAEALRCQLTESSYNEVPL